MPRANVVLLFVLVVACGPAPVRPRPSPPPVTVTVRDAAPSEPMVVDAGVPGEVGGEAGMAPDVGGDAGAAGDVAGDRVDAHPVAEDGAPDVPAARPPEPGDLVITEVLANPLGTDTGREWIEIANLATVPLDLSELYFADAVMEVAVAAGTIDAHGLLVLAQSADASKNGGVAAAVGYGTRLSLNNDGEQLTLCLGACVGGVVIDRLSWGALGAAYDGHALIVDVATKVICPAGDGFGIGGDFGTPGVTNPECPGSEVDSRAD